MTLASRVSVRMLAQWQQAHVREEDDGCGFGVLNVVVAAMEVLLAVADLRSREEELVVTITNGDVQMLIRVRCREAHGGAADLWCGRREKMVKVRIAAMTGSSPATSDGGWLVAMTLASRVSVRMLAQWQQAHVREEDDGCGFGVLNVVVAAMEVLLAVADLRSREEELVVTITNGDVQMLVRFCNGEDGRANGADEHGDCYVV
ncbi:hypothetical protein DEO72_LG5g1859 [Vigna unguiculata]|uniref:Uncharacterized protein n=1 Tax=Vigna unguiculata TaxID=3917 RepID=A0A4D6LZ54_VIGUN|nr:hypothetical protein DEO72_LG5g1859 [Vigna unguiculata]